jgi:hypothetical protein
MAKPLAFDIKNQDQVIRQLPPFFNMKEKSEVNRAPWCAAADRLLLICPAVL